jgi:hypothetical protein
MLTFSTTSGHDAGAVVAAAASAQRLRALPGRGAGSSRYINQPPELLGRPFPS